jgi:hypothetical protein
MAQDSAIPVRKAILRALKADSDVTALVPADRIYPPQRPAEPEWPFILYGASIDTALKGSCLDGSTITVAIHQFAKGEEDTAAIKAAVATALDGLEAELLDAGYPARASVIVTGGRVIADSDEGDSWHGIVDLEITVAS